MPIPLDRDRVQYLANRHLGIIKSNYVKGPLGRERVLESLNALAVAVAFVLAGTHPDNEAQEFFNTALANQIDSILENLEERNEQAQPGRPAD